MQNGYIFISKKDNEEIVYGNDRFYVNKAGTYEFDFRQNWYWMFILLVVTEGSIWLSQYVEAFFYQNKPIVLCLIVFSIYLAAKLANVLIQKLNLGYKREDLKRIRMDIAVDEDMVHSCQKQYVKYTLQEVGLALFAVLLYSIFFFTVRLYGLVCGMLIITAFCMIRQLSNYSVYRTFMQSYKENNKNDSEQINDEIAKAAMKKRNG